MTESSKGLGPRNVTGAPIARPGRSAGVQTYVPEIAKGLAITMKHFFQNTKDMVLGQTNDPVLEAIEDGINTISYPEQRRPYPTRFRGLHRLTHREDGSARCVACLCCSTACPAQCIHIEAGEYPEGDPKRGYERFPIVDVDSHHYESESMMEILDYLDDPVLRQLALSAGQANAKSNGVVPSGVGYQDMGGRVTRYPLRKMEKTDGPQHRDITLTKRWMDCIGIDVAINPRDTTVSSILQHVRRGRIKAVHTIRDGEAEIFEAEALETSPLVGRPLKEMRSAGGMIVGAIVRDGAMITPRPETVIKAHDRVVIVARSDMVKKVEQLFAVRLDYF